MDSLLISISPVRKLRWKWSDVVGHDLSDFHHPASLRRQSSHPSFNLQPQLAHTMFGPSVRAASRRTSSLSSCSLLSLSRARPLLASGPRLTPFSSTAARSFHASRPAQSLTNIYEAGDNPPLSVNRLDERGFLLSDGLLVPGGVVFADGRAFLWDVDPPGDGRGGVEKAWEGWTKERFEVFEKVVPRPGEFVVGGVVSGRVVGVGCWGSSCVKKVGGGGGGRGEASPATARGASVCALR